MHIGNKGFRRARIHATELFGLTETVTTPTLPENGTEAKIYLKANNLVIYFNEGGTPRYMYLPLDAAAATWAYSATEPT